jgi:hypothetical protein
MGAPALSFPARVFARVRGKGPEAMKDDVKKDDAVSLAASRLESRRRLLSDVEQIREKVGVAHNAAADTQARLTRELEHLEASAGLDDAEGIERVQRAQARLAISKRALDAAATEARAAVEAVAEFRSSVQKAETEFARVEVEQALADSSTLEADRQDGRAIAEAVLEIVARVDALRARRTADRDLCGRAASMGIQAFPRDAIAAAGAIGAVIVASGGNAVASDRLSSIRAAVDASTDALTPDMLMPMGLDAPDPMRRVRELFGAIGRAMSGPKAADPSSADAQIARWSNARCMRDLFIEDERMRLARAGTPQRPTSAALHRGPPAPPTEGHGGRVVVNEAHGGENAAGRFFSSIGSNGARANIGVRTGEIPTRAVVADMAHGTPAHMLAERKSPWR